MQASLVYPCPGLEVAIAVASYLYNLTFHHAAWQFYM